MGALPMNWTGVQRAASYNDFENSPRTQESNGGHIYYGIAAGK